MQLAGNFGNFPKVNITQKSALLDPRMREYAPSAGFEQRCDSDSATREGAVRWQRAKLRFILKVISIVQRPLSVTIGMDDGHRTVSDVRYPVLPTGTPDAGRCPASNDYSDRLGTLNNGHVR